MKRFLICFGFLMLVCLFAPGCTVHFKGENLEMDVERQRVYKFDGITFTRANMPGVSDPYQ